VLGDVIRAGYDRSFDALHERDQRDPEWRSAPGQFGKGCSDIVVSGSTVRLPAGVGFDPGVRALRRRSRPP